MISLIVAIAHDNVIGRSNDLPWYLPADLKHFKEMTTGHTVIMGHKTYDSIATRLGGPLPNRHNVIVTRNEELVVPGVTVAHSLELALNENENGEVFVIGGSEVYAQSLPHADKLYITEVDADIVGGDTFFPAIDMTMWRETSREAYKKDDRNEYDYAFVTYERV